MKRASMAACLTADAPIFNSIAESKSLALHNSQLWNYQ
jgi:hypothetical protein